MRLTPLMMGKRAVSASERALGLVEKGPRVDLALPRDNPGAKTKPNQVSAAHNRAGKGHKMAQRAAAPPLGYVFGDWFTPWQRRCPGDPHLNKVLFPFSSYVQNQVSAAHNRAGKGHKMAQRAAAPPLGYVFGDWFTPWQRRCPGDPHLNKVLFPFSPYVQNQVSAAHNRAGKGHKMAQRAAAPPLSYVFGDWFTPWQRRCPGDPHLNKVLFPFSPYVQNQVSAAHNRAGKGHKMAQRAAAPPLGYVFGDWFTPWQRRCPGDPHLNKVLFPFSPYVQNQVSAAHNRAGKGHKMAQRAAAPPLGYVFGDWFTPWQRRCPGDPHLNKVLFPFSPYVQNQVSAAHNRAGKGHKMAQRAAAPPLGYVFGDWFTPWQRRCPGDPHLNKDVHLKREYPPLSLLELQRLIDTGLLDPSLPIDLAALVNTQAYHCDPLIRQFGVQLTPEGSDIFSACIDIEVQAADEETVAAVERAGGRITAAYFDPVSLIALCDTETALSSGEPIPRRGFPPPDIIDRYTDPTRRGYLADPSAVDYSRRELAQRFGYSLSPPKEHIQSNPLKHPLQVFYGLEAGWVISLRDRAILKPTDSALLAYYEGNSADQTNILHSDKTQDSVSGSVAATAS